jgi:hypothetical protein
VRSLGSAIGRDKSREILDYGSAADPASFRSVMRVSSHRFQTKVTISVPLRFSASPRSSSSRKKRARTSTGRLRSRPHRTCSVERVILHWCKIVTPPSKLGGGVCPAISAFSRATLAAREAVERSRSGPSGTPLVAAAGCPALRARYERSDRQRLPTPAR